MGLLNALQCLRTERTLQDVVLTSVITLGGHTEYRPSKISKALLASGVKVRAFNRKIDYILTVHGILNPKGFQNCSTGSNFSAILPDRPSFACW